MKTKAQTTPLACIILAAGKGTRMRSALPKVLHKVAHKPMLLHVVDTARAVKAEKIIVVTSPEMDPIRDALKRHYKDTVANAIQQEQLGTGDAVKAAKTALKDFTGIVLVLYGDAPLIQPATITAMLEAFNKDPDLSLLVLGMEAPLPNDYGRLVLNKKGDVERIVEVKEASAKEKAITLSNSGVMAVRSKLLFPLLAKLSNKNAKGEYYLTDLVALVNQEGRAGFVTADAQDLHGVNSRGELAAAEAIMQNRMRKQAIENGVTLLDPATVYFAADTKLGQDVTIHPNVFFGPGVEVGNNVEIRSFCHIEGTKILAAATIGPFARLRPGTRVGESAHVGNFVELKQTTLERGAKVNHLSYIGDAYVGPRANIGAGTITCNFDGFSKHHTSIGAGAFIGSNTSLVAPVNIGEGAVTGAGSVITEDVENDALAIARAPQKQKQNWAKSFRNKKHN